MYDKLIIQIRQLQHWFKPNESECFDPYEILEKAADAIEELQAQLMFSNDAAKTIAEKVPKWIPVTERLPGEFGRYLCRYRVEDGKTIGYCTDFGKYDPEHGEWFVGTVTHWMPLPQPPKEDKDGAE